MKSIITKLEALAKEIGEQTQTGFRDNAISGIGHTISNLKWHEEEMERRHDEEKKKAAPENAASAT